MAQFLLIHGASHGAWCWRDVLPVLAALGHEARAIDLPSHGNDQTAPEGVTLGDYADAIVAALDEPTILVGHSMGGYPITLAAEKAPDIVAGLVYLTAYTPWGNRTISDMRDLSALQPIRPALQIAADQKTLTYDPKMVGDLFYHDCPEGTLEYAHMRLKPQSIQPMLTRVELSHSPSLPRSYILCTEDHAVPLEAQRKMAARLPAEDVYEIATSHSPFFSDPVGLAQILDRIAAKA